MCIATSTLSTVPRLCRMKGDIDVAKAHTGFPPTLKSPLGQLA
jgi:hypothetical protein